jgi:hypothetical protein
MPKALIFCFPQDRTKSFRKMTKNVKQIQFKK